MLYVVYPSPELVRLAEYVPHFLVRASSKAAALRLIERDYPKHPLPLRGSATVVAELGALRRLTLPDVELPFFIASEEQDLALLSALCAALQARSEGAPLADWYDVLKVAAYVPAPAALASSEVLPSTGRAEVLCRGQNFTPALQQGARPNPVFVWQAVRSSWPRQEGEQPPPLVV